MVPQGPEELFRLMYREILRYATRHCPADAAEDVVSETFLTVVRKQDQIPQDLALARAWVFTIARKHVAHSHRTRCRQMALSERVEECLGVPFVAQDVAIEVIESLSARSAFASLSPSDQEVIAAAAWKHLTSDELCAVLELSKAACTSRLRRARRRLVAALHRASIDDHALR